VSADAIREEICGSVSDQSQNERVWAEVYTRIQAALLGQFNLVVDVTNANIRDRRILVEFVRRWALQSGITFKVTGMYYKAPLWLCVHRNAARERETGRPAVPVHAIRRMHERLNDSETHPSLWDGFDELIVVEAK
jgi:predicted kinase